MDPDTTLTHPRPPRAEVWRSFPTLGTTARPCKRCGIPIAFGVGHVPLDLTTLRIVVSEAGDPDLDAQPVRWEARSHYETCPHAAEFSRGRKRS